MSHDCENITTKNVGHRLKIFIDPKGGGVQLSYQNHWYTKKLTTRTQIIWACSHCEGCDGSLTTDLWMEKPVLDTPHCHGIKNGSFDSK